ncbi:cuticle protein CP14.6-like [Cydia pomonella]|uniref:cuticle protein CP14.6-like n=1 Tax=Cydia pomonella TaxID=82600 RepID=UPI002ADE6991|nr:cuticle protein CP14.6-like [Cydia pomonella]
MKSFLVFALCAAVALAAPQRQAYSGDEKQAETLRYDNNVDVYAYNVNVETSNGIKEAESGILNNQGKDNEAFVRSGQYAYTAPDGVTYSVTWTADENGYHPQGAHLPQ